MNIKSIISRLAIVVLFGLNTTTYANSGMAMTWKTKTPPQLTGSAGKIGNKRIVVVGCSGCDAYKGDTSINTKLRILCIIPSNQPEPAVYAAQISAPNSFKKFYYNWSGGFIGLTNPIKGTSITSRAKGDQFCKTSLQDNRARMIEHHDNKVGGWNAGGFIHPNSKAKGQLRNPGKTKNYWAVIKNQRANPWNSANARTINLNIPGNSSVANIENSILRVLEKNSRSLSANVNRNKRSYAKRYANQAIGMVRKHISTNPDTNPAQITIYVKVKLKRPTEFEVGVKL